MASLHLPASVTCLAFGPSAQLGVASEDGTVRVYEAPYQKVSKAVRNLSSEVSSLVFPAQASDVWIACGQHVLCFSLETPRMILERNDAKVEIRLTDEHEDVLNEIAINGLHLAYTLDSGAVGVVDLKTHEKTEMKSSHSNLCTNVSFIPDRPRELVSGGYDSTLLHFDFHLKSLLSSLQMSAPSEPSAQVSLSPPFVSSLSVAQTGLVACGLADGRIWLGSGGAKALSSEASSTARKKKRRKWEGLRADDGSYFKTAEGPIVGIAFASTERLVSLTLLGTLALHDIEAGRIQRVAWTTESPGLSKANALAVHGLSVAIGGVDSANKGILLIRPLQPSESPRHPSEGDGSDTPLQPST